MTSLLSLTGNRSLLVFVFLCAKIAMGFSQETPRIYVANKAVENFTIDGKPDEASWKKAAWSDLFIDIEGKRKPLYDTRMKMSWDDQNLYIYAQLSEPHVWANLKERDTIIFYNNDFEIFIDPDGDTHNYYEFEMNALNTIWDLFLSKPYRNKGTILGGWDFKGLKSAVHIQGTLNDASDVDIGWSVEVAIPWSFVTEPGGIIKIPKNEYWRINFSRVNWDFDLVDERYSRKKDMAGNFLPEYNWVWSPQGVINMHEPESWGYVYFSSEDKGEIANFSIPKDEHLKWYLYEQYRKIRSVKNSPDVNLQSLISTEIIFGNKIFARVEEHISGWNIWVESPFTNSILLIEEDGKFNSYKAKE